MAITAYTGVPGTGKSYALVSEVIVPGVRSGRRVLTNVSGVDPQKVVDYCREKWPKEADHVGSVVLFEGHQTTEPAFFPAEDKTLASIIQPGDLVVFDEVRMFWPRRGSKFSPDIIRFLRYHRHFVSDETHQSTDVVLASQIISDFHEDFKGCIERNFKFRKLSSIGLKSRYVYNVWEGSDQRKGQNISRGGGRYKPEIFNLYSSYVGGKGSEKSTDRRANALANPRLLAGLAFMIVVFIFGWWGLSSFGGKDAPKAPMVGAVAVQQAAISGVTAPVPGVAGAPPVSSIWRISGSIQTPGLNVVVLVDRSGNVRYEDPSNFTMVDDRPYVGIVDGQRVLSVGMAAPVAASFPSFGAAR
jgi:zona occludens toxin